VAARSISISKENTVNGDLDESSVRVKLICAKSKLNMHGLEKKHPSLQHLMLQLNKTVDRPRQMRKVMKALIELYQSYDLWADTLKARVSFEDYAVSLNFNFDLISDVMEACIGKKGEDFDKALAELLQALHDFASDKASIKASKNILLEEEPAPFRRWFFSCCSHVQPHTLSSSLEKIKLQVEKVQMGLSLLEWELQSSISPEGSIYSSGGNTRANSYSVLSLSFLGSLRNESSKQRNQSKVHVSPL